MNDESVQCVTIYDPWPDSVLTPEFIAWCDAQDAASSEEGL